MESLRGRVRKWWLRLYNSNCSPVFSILFSAPAFFYLKKFLIPCYFSL